MFTIPGLALFKKFFGYTWESLAYHRLGRFKSGWYNFCTPVGHFSKLFEFASRIRLKTSIFVPKSGCSLKKKKRSSLGIGLQNFYFRPKVRVFSKKKKVFTRNRSLKLLIQTVKNYICSRKKFNEKLEPNVSCKTL